jgi:hypothetical protein
MKKQIIAIVFVATLVIILIIVSMYYGYSNAEITLRKEVEAQELVCRANHDKMYKVLAQIVQVPNEFIKKSTEAFQKIYQSLIEGRYGSKENGVLSKWINESNPNFDLNSFEKLYEKVQIAVEANREEYFLEQKKLIDIHREHSTFIAKFPARLFVNTKEIKIKIITSSQTEVIYDVDGYDDNVKLFK